MQELYQKRESWFLEFTGVYKKDGLPANRSLYVYKEHLNLYDMNVQVACLVQGTPAMVFMQQNEDITT